MSVKAFAGTYDIDITFDILSMKECTSQIDFR